MEEVVRRPGLTYAELTRAVGAPKSTVHGFIKGLLAEDWLYESDRRLYTGPAVYGLFLYSSHMRVDLVSPVELNALREDSGLTALIGVRSGDHFIHIAESGSDLVVTEDGPFVRQGLTESPGGRAFLAALHEEDLQQFLRSRPPEEREHVASFLRDYHTIRTTGVAVVVNETLSRAGIATAITDASGRPIASVVLLGSASDMLSRLDGLGELLRDRAREWKDRSFGRRTLRNAGVADPPQ